MLYVLTIQCNSPQMKYFFIFFVIIYLLASYLKPIPVSVFNLNGPFNVLIRGNVHLNINSNIFHCTIKTFNYPITIYSHITDTKTYVASHFIDVGNNRTIGVFYGSNIRIFNKENNIITIDCE